MIYRLIHADVLDGLRSRASESVQVAVTSPPYWGLRDYGVTPSVWGGDPEHDHDFGESITIHKGGPHGNGVMLAGGRAVVSAQAAMKERTVSGVCACGAWLGVFGLEPTPALYVEHAVLILRELRRVLANDGTLWLNIGDTYGTGTTAGRQRGTLDFGTGTMDARQVSRPGGAAKQLMGIPWRVAFALQADGWYLRSDIIWCLSGGTRLYARTQKGDGPATLKDLARLDPSTVQLWNGERWTRVLGWSRTQRPDRTFEIEIRSGERIGCTAGHHWPTARGLVRAEDLKIGDVIDSCSLPEPESPRRPGLLPDDIGWFVGLYIAEGSRSDGTVQVASHADDHERFERLQKVAQLLDGTCARHQTSAHGATINLNGPAIVGVLDAYVAGRVASDKHLHPRCWRRTNQFLSSVLRGYLDGDAHFDGYNQRWRLGFTQNDALAADIRTIAARLGATLSLRRVFHKMNGERFPGYRGELRFERSGHHNEKPAGLVVAIRESRAREFWDVGVADEPHTFALASGVLTHNSKPNPMPESVTDRPTKAHEYLFLLAKSPKYFYDADAIAERAVYGGEELGIMRGDKVRAESMGRKPSGNELAAARRRESKKRGEFNGKTEAMADDGRNAFRAIKDTRNKRSVWTVATQPFPEAHFATFPEALIEPCILAGSRIGDTVLDPFNGSGTTGVVALKNQRDYIGIELNAEYVQMARRRIGDVCPLWAKEVSA